MALPLLSVILPVRNEEAFIEQTLSTVLAQTWDKNALEILVVDGQSTDRTRELAAAVLANAGVARFAILENPGQTAPCALNIGLRAARGPLIARVDGHCALDPRYFELAWGHLEQTGADGVGGRLETVGKGASAEAIAAAMSSAFGVGGAAFRLAGAEDSVVVADTIAFPVYRRATLDRVGFFDESFRRNQDDEYNFRLRKLGGRLLLAGNMRVQYFSRSSFTKLTRQYFEYGVYKIKVASRHPRQMSLRHWVPASFVLALLTSAVSLAFSPWPLVAVAGSYGLANLGASVVVGFQRGFLAPTRWNRWIRLPLAFACLHLAYGAGCCFGLWKRV